MLWTSVEERQELLSRVEAASSDNNTDDLNAAVASARELLSTMGFLPTRTRSSASGACATPHDADDRSSTSNEQQSQTNVPDAREDRSSFELLEEIRSRRENFWVNLSKDGFVNT